MEHSTKGVSPEIIVRIMADFLSFEKLKTGHHVLSLDEARRMVLQAQESVNGGPFDIRFNGEDGICLRFHPNNTVEELYQHDEMLNNVIEKAFSQYVKMTSSSSNVKSIVAVCLSLVAISLMGVNVPQTTGQYIAPEKVVYGIKEVCFDSSKNDATLVIPKCVKQVSYAAFLGPLVTSGLSSSSAPYEQYRSIAESGVKRVLFLGDCPTIDHTAYSSMLFFQKDYTQYYLNYGQQVNEIQLMNCTCFYVEGTCGWTNPTFCSATVSPGSAIVQMDPCQKSGDVHYYLNAINVALTSSNDRGTIYYTLDGSEPTKSSAKYTSPIYIDDVVTVKAISVVNGYPFAVPSSCVYAQGTVACPTVIADELFDHSNQTVVMSCATDGVTLRYTTDGSEPTTNSCAYVAPLQISETTTFRVKGFRKGFFDSEETVQTFTRLWYTNETPVVSATSEMFDTASQEVSLSCGTDDATIYYTLDGSEPSVANGRVYKGPFDIYQTTTVKAIAVKADWKDSAVVSATFTKANEIGPAINLLEMLPDNDKTHPWTVVTDVTHDGVSAVKSGEISDDESTTMKVVVYGAGELSFWWRTSCEPTIGGEWYDFATFYDGTTAVTNLAGVTDWQRVVRSVEGTGKHTFKWTYQKDGSGSTVPDGV